jgi:hypothetical protein
MRHALGVILLLVVGSAQAAPVELLTNGGFETGDFTGWTASTNGSGSCDTDWNVSAVGGSSATGCTGTGFFGFSAPGAPTEGSFAAYNSFDGDGPQTFTLSQDFTVMSGPTTVSWSDTASWDLNSFGATLDRTFSVDVYDGGALVGNIFSLDILAGTFSEYDWTSRSIDITSLLSGYEGQTLALQFSNFIPENFSGPAGFGLDGVSLTAVPIPAAVWLFGSGLGLLGWFRRRQSA